jgi:hypothetical protein
MASYRVRLINAEFESSDEAEYASAEEALRSAIAGATRIAGDSVAKGELSSAVEIQVYDGTELVDRHIVTVSLAGLIVEH